MKLDFFEIDGKNHYNAIIWENGNVRILDEYFTTKKEAVKAINEKLKNKKLNKNHLDIYIRFHDKTGYRVYDIEKHQF